MEIAELIQSRLRTVKAARGGCAVVGICGRAGSGKTTITERIAKFLNARGDGIATYSGDWRFLMDSESRRRWLSEKWKVGIDAYTNAINQFNWWNFQEIQRDLQCIKEGRPLRLANAYNRTTGRANLAVDIPALSDGAILYENCILGGIDILVGLDLIVLVNTPDAICLKRIIKKDAARRSVAEIAARYLMTTYSENIFFELVLTHFREKVIVCDSHGRFSSFPDIQKTRYIPVPTPESRITSPAKGTVFCDLDGTLVKHVPIPSETGDDIEVIEGSVEKLRDFKSKGYYLVLTTSRVSANIIQVLEKLQANGLHFDQVICDLPIGPRYLINDSKDAECRAVAYPIVRDSGISQIHLT
jgi:uridine kinase